MIISIICITFKNYYIKRIKYNEKVYFNQVGPHHVDADEYSIGERLVHDKEEEKVSHKRISQLALTMIDEICSRNKYDNLK